MLTRSPKYQISRLISDFIIQNLPRLICQALIIGLLLSCTILTPPAIIYGIYLGLSTLVIPASYVILQGLLSLAMYAAMFVAACILCGGLIGHSHGGQTHSPIPAAIINILNSYYHSNFFAAIDNIVTPIINLIYNIFSCILDAGFSMLYLPFAAIEKLNDYLLASPPPAATTPPQAGQTGLTSFPQPTSNPALISSSGPTPHVAPPTPVPMPYIETAPTGLPSTTNQDGLTM